MTTNSLADADKHLCLPYRGLLLLELY